MQIRMTTHLSGHLVDYSVGQEITMPDNAALRLIAAGFAEEVKSAPVVVEKADRKLKAETR